MSKRLIEHWLPIAALGEESIRERRSMTALPPTYYLHACKRRKSSIFHMISGYAIGSFPGTRAIVTYSLPRSAPAIWRT